eukprot:jgi/Hompol1/4003/HPOL_001673-RA
MAWQCSGSSNAELISKLYRAGLHRSTRVHEAMLAVDRRHFSPSASVAYEDSPQLIGFGATISAPHMHSSALDRLEPFLKSGMRALDVGCGSGYLTACMAEMVGPKGVVVGVEHIPQLLDLSRSNIEKHKPELLSQGIVRLKLGDGRKDFFTGEDVNKFDAIHVGAAASILPESLVEQLAKPGRMIIPIGPSRGDQVLLQIDKDEDGAVFEKVLMAVQYVPLTSAAQQTR